MILNENKFKYLPCKKVLLAHLCKQVIKLQCTIYEVSGQKEIYGEKLFLLPKEETILERYRRFLAAVIQQWI